MLEHARPVDADTHAGQAGYQLVQDVAGDPVGALVVRSGLVGLRLDAGGRHDRDLLDPPVPGAPGLRTVIINENNVRVKYLCSQPGAVTLGAMPGPPSVPYHASSPVRPTHGGPGSEELSTEILAVARRHLADEGAAALSLRSVAHDLGMAPSALYRYFDGRDALLAALIVAAYEALAETAEAAADEAQLNVGSDAERWQAVPRALRAWALARPHEWGLVFGSPVPGYHTPYDTVTLYARIAAALLRPVVEAKAAGRLRMDVPTRPVSDALRHTVAPVREELLPDMTVDKVVVAVEDLDLHHRRRQPRGVRALARYHPRPGRAVRGHDA